MALGGKTLLLAFPALSSGQLLEVPTYDDNTSRINPPNLFRKRMIPSCSIKKLRRRTIGKTYLRTERVMAPPAPTGCAESLPF